MKKLIVGNWKMNTTRSEAHELVKGLQESANSAVDMVICPPAVWLADIAATLKAPLLLGAQDCHAADKGAFTGNIAASMLKELGCAYVIVGHSERRALHLEDNATVKSKAMAAIKHGLIPIICVGESAEERETGSHEVVVGQQLVESLPNSGNYVVAYEPVWAIGTGKTATIGDVEAMHRFIRHTLAKTVDHADKVAILYGGSVKATNAAEILATKNVDGVLVGGASLQLEEFRAIAQAAPH
jgi:triosephosphate isomerase